MILNDKDFEILNFYGYTSVIMKDNRIYEVSALDDNVKEKRRYEILEKFYNNIVERAEHMCNNIKITKYMFGENKSVFKLKHIKSGNIIYIGKYDFEISIGLNVNQRFGHSYDFISEQETYKNEEL